MTKEWLHRAIKVFHLNLYEFKKKSTPTAKEHDPQPVSTVEAWACVLKEGNQLFIPLKQGTVFNS